MTWFGMFHFVSRYKLIHVLVKSMVINICIFFIHSYLLLVLKVFFFFLCLLCGRPLWQQHMQQLSWAVLSDCSGYLWHQATDKQVIYSCLETVNFSSPYWFWTCACKQFWVMLGFFFPGYVCCYTPLVVNIHLLVIYFVDE